MFNPNTLECDHPSKVQCQRFEGFSTTRNQRQLFPTGTIQCEAGASGLYAHPLDCRKFLNCDHGRTHVQECGPGTAFNDIIKVCDWPHKVDCGTRAPELVGNDLNTGESQHQPFYGEGMLDARMGELDEPQATNRQHHQQYAAPQNRQHFPQQQQHQWSQQSHDGTNSHSLQSFSSIGNPSSSPSFNAPPNSYDDSSPKSQVVNVPSQDLLPPFKDSASNNGKNSSSSDRTGRKGSGIGVPHNPLDEAWLHGSLDTVETNFLASTTETNIDHSILAQRNKPAASPKAFPNFNEMARRIDEEYQKQHQNSNSKPPLASLPQPSTSTERQSHTESATKVYHIYPSGFETMGAQCQADGMGLMAHPYDCSRYVHCENGRIRVQTCEAGFMFNPTLKRCDFAQNVHNCNSGVNPSVAVPDESLNEIHTDEKDRKPYDFGLRISTEPTEPTPHSNQSPYFIPDMSVLPLESDKYPQNTYPNTQQWPLAQHKPSQGGDVPLADFDEPSAFDNRNKKGLFHGNPALNFGTTTPRPTSTTERQHVMRIPAGKEHAMPIYQRPTKSTTKPYAALQSGNQLSYQPFAQPPKDTDEKEESDYVPISEAIKLLLRPYIARNDTKSTLNATTSPETHMNKIENKLLDLIDHNANHSKALEQDSLAAAALNENVAVKNLPEAPHTQIRSGFESFDEDTYETTPKANHHNHHHQNHNNNQHQTHVPSPRPTYYKPGTNEPIDDQIIAFPGPHSQSHPMHGYYHHSSTPSASYFSTTPPPLMHANHHHPSHHLGNHQSQQNFGPNYHTNAANFGLAHHNRHLTPPPATTTPATASAPPPNWYSTNDKPVSAQVRFGKSEFEVSTCLGQFDCGTGFCIPFSRVSATNT